LPLRGKRGGEESPGREEKKGGPGPQKKEMRSHSVEGARKSKEEKEALK